MQHKKESVVTKYILLRIFYYKYTRYGNSVTITIIKYFGHSLNILHYYKNVSKNLQKGFSINDQIGSLLKYWNALLLQDQKGTLLNDLKRFVAQESRKIPDSRIKRVQKGSLIKNLLHFCKLNLFFDQERARLLPP